MEDVVFVAIVVGFFVVAALFIRACELIVGRALPAEEERRRLTVDNAVGLVLAVALLAYLSYALLAPERLG